MKEKKNGKKFIEQFHKKMKILRMILKMHK